MKKTLLGFALVLVSSFSNAATVTALTGILPGGTMSNATNPSFVGSGASTQTASTPSSSLGTDDWTLTVGVSDLASIVFDNDNHPGNQPIATLISPPYGSLFSFVNLTTGTYNFLVEHGSANNVAGNGASMVSRNYQYTVTTTVTQVPEPSSISLMVSGLIMFGFMVRSRKSS